MILGEPGFSVQPARLSPLDSSPFLCFGEGRVLLVDQGPSIPTWAQVRPLMPPGAQPLSWPHRAGRDFLPAPL